MKFSVKFISAALSAAMLLGLCTACASKPAAEESSAAEEIILEDMELDMVPLSSEAPTALLAAVASGTVTYGNTKAAVDASNTKDGYIMIKYLGSNPKVKIQITGPSGTTYTYNVTKANVFEVFPLSDGSGSYKVGVYENSSGTKYSTAFSMSKLAVTLDDEFEPFLRANQYVNYNADSDCVALAAELCAGKKDTIEKINAIYSYVIKNITYDYDLAANVKSGYLPDLNKVLANKKGICFDYAALMTAMLRSQNIPTKLVVGYTGSAYHAWINTYSDEDGWMDSVIYFDGSQWKLMDPTFASNSNSSDSIMQYIGNGSNYSAKYLY